MSLKNLSLKLRASLEQRASQEEKSTAVTGDVKPATESVTVDAPATDAAPAVESAATDPTPATEGVVTAAIAGGIAPLIALPIYGHKLEEALKQRDEVKKKIDEVKKKIKDADEKLNASHESLGTGTEGLKGAAAGLVSGAVAAGATVAAPGLGIGAGAASAAVARGMIDDARAEKTKLEHELRLLEAQLDHKENTLLHLKASHKAAHEAYVEETGCTTSLEDYMMVHHPDSYKHFHHIANYYDALADDPAEKAKDMSHAKIPGVKTAADDHRMHAEYFRKLSKGINPAHESAEPATEDATPAVEAMNKGHFAGAFGHGFATAHYENKLQNKIKELESIHDKLLELKKKLKEAHSSRQAMESFDFTASTEGARWEGFKKAYQGWGLLAPGIKAMLVAGKQVEAIKAIDQQIAEGKEAIARLEAELRSKASAATEAFDETLSLKSFEDVGLEAINAGHVKASFGGAFTTAKYNVKIEKAKKKLEELLVKIHDMQEKIKEAKSYHATRESHEGEWTESMEGAYWEGFKRPFKEGHLLVPPSIKAVGIAGKQHEELKELQGKIAEAEKELAELKQEYHQTLVAAKEAFSESLEAFTLDALEEPAQESMEPKAAESQAAVDGAPVVDQATVAAPEGGERVVDVSLHEEPGESAEDALNGASDASDLVDDAMRESSDLNRDVTSLESVLYAVREHVGGLSREDAGYAHSAIESITSDWDLNVSICPSVESFGAPGQSASINATASLEANLVEVRNKIIAYVKEMFQKFAQFLVRFYEYISNSSKQLAMRGVKLSQAVQALGATAPRKGALDIGSLAGRVTADGRLAAPGTIMRAVEQQFDYAVMLDQSVQRIEAAAAAQAQRIRQATSETFEQVLAEAQAEYVKATEPPQFFVKDGEAAYRTMIFPGEVFYSAVQEDGHWRYKVQKSGKTPTATAIATPSADKLKALGVEAAKFGTAAGNKLEALSRAVINDKGQRFLAVLEGQTAQITDEQNAKLGRFLQDAAEDVKAVHALAKDILMNAVKAALATIRIGEMSVELYQPKGVGEKAGEAAAAIKEGAVTAAEAAKEKAAAAGAAVKSAVASATGKGEGEPAAA